MAVESEAHSIIQFVDISKNYGNFTAVSHLNLEIMPGEILGFVGPNGAGKSTTMKMLAGLLKPSGGEIRVLHDSRWVRLTPGTRDMLMERMGFLLETPTFYENVSPRILLTYFAKLNGYPRSKISQRVGEVLEQIGLEEWANKPVRQFSKGMRQKLGIIAAIVHDPDVVVLDEPQSGLDPRAQKEMRGFIRLLKEQGKTIFLSSHFLYEITEVADRVAIISHGELLTVDSLSNLEGSALHHRVKVRILTKPTNAESGEIIAHFGPLIAPLTGLTGESEINEENAKQNLITYNPDAGEFEIEFDGTPQVQRTILKQLIDAGLEVIEYNLPKTSLLEDSYLSLVNENDQKTEDGQNNQKKTKNPRPSTTISRGGVEFISEG
jgi:ABC-2 type transport system ATP-binding protein